MKSRAALLSLAASLAAACSSESASRADARASSSPSIDERELLAHIAELSSDRYEGRGPGTPGEELTVAYLTQQFRALGLAPGNPDGTYVQEVPLVGFRAEPRLRFWTGKEDRELAFPSEYV